MSLETVDKIAHVVMVDDDKDDLFLTKLYFERAEFPFKFTGLEGAEDLFNFIEKDRMSDIDILLLDFNMPGISGVEALKTLREKYDLGTVKVFMFSSSSCEFDRNQSIDAGADGYLFKPSGADAVKRFVNTISLASEFWVSV